jgi:hypothetical protein
MTLRGKLLRVGRGLHYWHIDSWKLVRWPKTSGPGSEEWEISLEEVLRLEGIQIW